MYVRAAYQMRSGQRLINNPEKLLSKVLPVNRRIRVRGAFSRPTATSSFCTSLTSLCQRPSASHRSHRNRQTTSPRRSRSHRNLCNHELHSHSPRSPLCGSRPHSSRRSRRLLRIAAAVESDLLALDRHDRHDRLACLARRRRLGGWRRSLLFSLQTKGRSDWPLCQGWPNQPLCEG